MFLELPLVYLSIHLYREQEMPRAASRVVGVTALFHFEQEAVLSFILLRSISSSPSTVPFMKLED
jgi:hypothetical protein